MAYQHLLPWAALSAFVLFLAFFWINKKYIADLGSELRGKLWFWLFLIWALALGLRLTVFEPYHRMFVDEFWYMEAAKEMLASFNQGSYPKSIGWPFILTFSFGIFGVSNWTAIYTTILLGSLTIFPVFFLTYLATKSKNAGIFAAVTFALLPLHIYWSTSAETNIPSLFFVVLALSFCLLYYQKKSYSLFWLALFSLIFVSFFRPENYILIPLFFIGIFIFRIKIYPKQIFLTVFMILILVVPAVVQSLDFQTSTNWLEKESFGQIEGRNWSFENLVNNTISFGPEVFTPQFMPLPISFLALLGVFLLVSKKPKETGFFLLGFAFFWLVYFSSWLQVLGGRQRFYLVFYPFILVFAGSSLQFFCNLFNRAKRKNVTGGALNFPGVFLAVIFIFSPYFLIAIRGKNEVSSPNRQLATKVPQLAEKILPQESIVLANWPVLLTSTTDLEVVDLAGFLLDFSFQEKLLQSEKRIFFWEGYFCFVDFCQRSREFCRLAKERFELKPYKEFRKREVVYTFYEVTGRSLK